MAVAVNDKITGTAYLKFADGTFFYADCQMTVTGTGDSSAPAAAAESPAAGATGATGSAAPHAAAAGHHDAKK